MVRSAPAVDADDRLTGWERAGLIGLLVLVAAFGVVTELRSAFQQTRKTDAGVYFRAAWAVHDGTSPYRITDDNDWNYHYPPTLAILLVPLADPPPDSAVAPPGWMMPYPVSIAIWYVVNVAALAAAVHLLAAAIESRGFGPPLRGPPRFGRRWWGLRIWPVVICLPMIGFTLGRGQVNLLLLLGICGMAAALLERRSLRAGLWLSLALCIKPYTGFLLLYPLWRRDGRCVLGCLLGLGIGLVLIPMAALGPERMVETYREMVDLRLIGIISGEMDPAIAGELQVTDAYFPNFAATLYKALHLDVAPADRPEELPAVYTLIGVAAGGLLTLATLGAAGWHRGRRPAGIAEIVFLGALTVVMLPMVPTLKSHYYALATVLAMGLIAAAWDRNGRATLGRGSIALFAAYAILCLITEVPEFHLLRELGLVTFATLGLWLAGLVVLWRHTRQTGTARTLPAPCGSGSPA